MAESSWNKNIVLVGFMGAGKSTVARSLAERLNLQLKDTDNVVAERVGRSISDIFAVQGEEFFRQKETQVLSDLVKVRQHVIATGGGIVLREENWSLMRQIGPVVFLQISSELLKKRLTGATGRPLADGVSWDDIALRYQERLSLYEKADIRVATDRKTPQMIVNDILKQLEQKNISWKF